MITYEASGLARKLPERPGVELAQDPRAEERLNVALPNFFKNYAFGGITSAMELARELSRHYACVRFLSLAPLGITEEMFDFNAYVSGAKHSVSVESIAGRPSFQCHQREIFYCTYWATVLLWQAYAQALRAGGVAVPCFYYFIQDYEPGFYPYGTRHSMSLATYEQGEHIHALFNAEELAQFFTRRGLAFKKNYILRPSLNPSMDEHLKARNYTIPAKPAGKTTIVVYGRPQTPRNCFEAVVEGLHRYFATLSPARYKDFEIISAGREHDDIELFPGLVLRSVGKLDLPAYIALLERAHIGVSLMASPHPSYPPLEMAVFGLVVLTNGYECKDLSRHHEAIRSLRTPAPEDVAAGLAMAVAELEEKEAKERPVRLPTNMSPLPWRENVRRLGLKRIAAPA